MPNGHDKNRIRLCAAADGFRLRHKRWPTRVRMHELSLQDLKSLFTRSDLAKLMQKLELVADDASMIAEDQTGAAYDYGREGFPKEHVVSSATDWLGVKPRAEEH